MIRNKKNNEGLIELDLAQIELAAGGTTRFEPLPIPPQRPPRLGVPPQRPMPILPRKPDVPPPSCPSVPML